VRLSVSFVGRAYGVLAVWRATPPRPSHTAVTPDELTGAPTKRRSAWQFAWPQNVTEQVRIALAAWAGFRIPRRSRADHAGPQWSMSSAIARVVKQSGGHRDTPHDLRILQGSAAVARPRRSMATSSARARAQKFRCSRVHHALLRLTCIAVTPFSPPYVGAGGRPAEFLVTHSRVPGSRGPILPGVNRQVMVGLEAVTRRRAAPARTRQLTR
jgi:hypothetical protein